MSEEQLVQLEKRATLVREAPGLGSRAEPEPRTHEPGLEPNLGLEL
jgi:hypothetical protein